MSKSYKNKETSSRKRKINENSHSKIHRNHSSLDKPSSRVLKPSSLTNLVEMVRRHTVFVPPEELSNGEALEGSNFVKFLQQHLNVVETPVTPKTSQKNTKQETIIEPEKRVVEKRKANNDLEDLYLANSQVEVVEVDINKKFDEHEISHADDDGIIVTSNEKNEISESSPEKGKTDSSINLDDYEVLDECFGEDTENNQIETEEKVQEPAENVEEEINYTETTQNPNECVAEQNIVEDGQKVQETDQNVEAEVYGEDEYYEYDYDENGRAYFYDENGDLYFYNEETGEAYIEDNVNYEGEDEVCEEESLKDTECAEVVSSVEEREANEELENKIPDEVEHLEDKIHKEAIEANAASDLEESDNIVEEQESCKSPDKEKGFQEEINTPEHSETDEDENEKEEESEEEQDDDIPCITLADIEEALSPNKPNSDTTARTEIDHQTSLSYDSAEVTNTSITSTINSSVSGKNELSINTDPFSQLDKEYVKTLTPTLTLHDEEVEEEFGLQPLITGEQLSEEEIPANKPLVLEKLSQIKDEDLDGKSSVDDDSNLEEPLPIFDSEKVDCTPSPRTTYEQTMNVLKANKALEEKVKEVEERVLVPTIHNKIEQDFQEFVDEDGGQVYVDRISEPALGFAVFDPTKTFRYYNYKHLPYLKRLIFDQPQNEVENIFQKLTCSDFFSSMLLESGIEDLFTSLSSEKSEEFMLFLWKVACCHPDYQIVTKTVEFFKLARMELPIMWKPSYDLVLETLINFGLTDVDNNCLFKTEFETISERLSAETNAYEEIVEILPSYQMEVSNQRHNLKLPIRNFSAMLDILSFFINESQQLVDTLVLLIWISMDPNVRKLNLRSKIQKCIENAINFTPEVFFGSYVIDLSKRVIEICDKHDDALCMVRGLPAFGKSRELQRIICMGILKRLLNIPNYQLKRDETIGELVAILDESNISPKMECNFLHSIISLIEIFVGNDVKPSQRVPLRLLSRILGDLIHKIVDNYLNPENSALKLHLTLIKSKWQIISHTMADEEKNVFTKFACLEALRN